MRAPLRPTRVRPTRAAPDPLRPPRRRRPRRLAGQGGPRGPVWVVPSRRARRDRSRRPVPALHAPGHAEVPADARAAVRGVRAPGRLRASRREAPRRRDHGAPRLQRSTSRSASSAARRKPRPAKAPNHHTPGASRSICGCWSGPRARRPRQLACTTRPWPGVASAGSTLASVASNPAASSWASSPRSVWPPPTANHARERLETVPRRAADGRRVDRAGQRTRRQVARDQGDGAGHGGHGEVR
jgi:hypothetical protein